MFLKVVIHRNVAFTHSNTQRDKTKTCHLPGDGPLKGSGFDIDQLNCYLNLKLYSNSQSSSQIKKKDI